MFEAASRASTAGHTASCRRLYSAMGSGEMPITMPMRCIACSLSFVGGQCLPQPRLRQVRRVTLRQLHQRLQAPRLFLFVVLRDVGEAVRQEGVEQPIAQAAEVAARFLTLPQR